MLGVAHDLAEDGDWFTARLGAKPVFVQLSGDKLSCLPNECSHRGFPLRNGDFGNGPIRCVLHYWTFDGDGRLSGVPGCRVEDLPMFQADLPQIDVERHGPFLFARSPASDVLELPPEIADCASLIDRIDCDVPADQPFVVDPGAVPLGPHADMRSREIDGRRYHVVRLLAPKTANRMSLRHWVFGEELALPDDADYSAVAVIRASLG